MKATLSCGLLLGVLAAGAASAQPIAVNPTGVNVNSEGATVVFLTFGRVGSYQAIEALWCGELTPAAPDIGLKCDPGTIFGSLPVRYDRLTSSGNSSSTDIMAIPPSVARRAYQAAESGAESRFFYVRRFVSATGGPDQYVAATCRLTGGGARVPLALTDVKLGFSGDAPVQFVETGGKLPPLRAEITYNAHGTPQGSMGSRAARRGGARVAGPPDGSDAADRGTRQAAAVRGRPELQCVPAAGGYLRASGTRPRAAPDQGRGTAPDPAAYRSVGRLRGRLQSFGG